MKKYSYCVYKHTQKNNHKIYVGITSQNINKRWNNGNGYKKCTHFFNAIQKYGWDSFEHKVLIHGLTKEQADRWEKRLIKQWDLMNPHLGYNLKEGGSNGIFSNESKKKMSNSKKGKQPYIITKETRLKMSQSQLGKHLSDITKEKIRNHFSKPVLRIEDNIIFNSMTIASKYSKCCRSHISECIYGKRKTAGGYHWAFA
jgi:group I intron endonuclease